MEKPNESHRRLCDKLILDLGKDINNLLINQLVNEIMLNPDGNLWADYVGQGQKTVGNINKNQAFAIINSLAGIHEFVINQHNPLLEAELPFYQTMNGERFTGQIPPIVTSPCFTIRKKSEKVYALEDYLQTKRITVNQLTILRNLIEERKNILVCGGPGSGKTTVTNALLTEIAKNDQNQRLIILEDVPELQCQALNKVNMLTSNEVNMTGLLRTAMRMRPDRIFIGEVRGKEALDLLKAWNTGCSGGVCTVHANGTEEAIQRILDLAMESGLVVAPITLILHTIDAIVSVVRNNHQKGFIQQITKLMGYQNETFKFSQLA